MKIGILLAGHFSGPMLEKHGDVDNVLGAMLVGNGFEVTSYAVCDHQFPDSVDCQDGWLVSGSINSANDDLVWINQLKAFIRDIYQQKSPLVGICFGHQVIASALGGVVEKYQGGWGVGNHQYQIEDSDFAPRIIAWHQDQVVEKPAAAQCIGGSDFCINAFLVYNNQVFTMQPHPEFSTELARDLLVVLKDNFDQAQVTSIEQSFEHSLDSIKLHQSIVQFFKTKQVVLNQ